MSPSAGTCFGKTELRPRQRITRRLRQRHRPPTRDSANHERPRQDWIEIPVPALISEDTFALAQEQLQKNKHHSPRRTIEPTLLQGMLACQNCGYAPRHMMFNERNAGQIGDSIASVVTISTPHGGTSAAD